MTPIAHEESSATPFGKEWGTFCEYSKLWLAKPLAKHQADFDHLSRGHP